MKIFATPIAAALALVLQGGFAGAYADGSTSILICSGPTA